MKTKIIVSNGTLNRAKEYAEEFPDTFIFRKGIVIDGHYFKPVCKYCLSPNLKKLKSPCRIQFKTYDYSCKKCKKPAEVTAIAVN